MQEVTWKEQQRPKVIARQQARKEVSLKATCENCGGTLNLERHHPDYDTPLEVVTLCKACHKAEHLRLNPAKKSKITVSLICPSCQITGEKNFVKNGFKKKMLKQVQRYQCKRCGCTFVEGRRGEE